MKKIKKIKTFRVAYQPKESDQIEFAIFTDEDLRDQLFFKLKWSDSTQLLHCSEDEIEIEE